MAETDDGAWFVPKRFGWGATPVTWQGWAVTLGFTAAIVAAARLRPSDWQKASVSAVLVAALVAIAAPRTRGGWRWRWGGE